MITDTYSIAVDKPTPIERWASMERGMSTPDYVRRAVRNYEKKVFKGQVVINPEKEDEAAILKAIEKSGMPFSAACKKSLKEYFKI